MASGFVLQTPDGAAYTITGKMRLGRGDDCQILLADDRVSRHHATAWVEAGRLQFRDESASNGTFVNGRRLRPGQTVALNPGDQVQLGTTFLLAGLASDPIKSSLRPAPVPGAAAPGRTVQMEAPALPAERPTWLPIAIGCGALALLFVCAAIIVFAFYSGVFQ
jgi:predicted component of type VI protein secretion system